MADRCDRANVGYYDPYWAQQQQYYATYSPGPPPSQYWTHASSSTAPRTYFCEVCKISCNSYQTYTDHVQGKKHARRVSEADPPSEDSTLIPIPTPTPTETSTPRTLPGQNIPDPYPAVATQIHTEHQSLPTETSTDTKEHHRSKRDRRKKPKPQVPGVQIDYTVNPAETVSAQPEEQNRPPDLSKKRPSIVIQTNVDADAFLAAYEQSISPSRQDEMVVDSVVQTIQQALAPFSAPTPSDDTSASIGATSAVASPSSGSTEENAEKTT